MSKPLDRLTLLETFTRISERGSISAAARDLGLSQASASRQLKELEVRLGTQLIRRTTHSLALTQSGRQVLADARELLSGWESLCERHAEGGQAVSGPLKVVAPVALGQLYLADIALDFLAHHPGISLTWELEDRAIRFAEVGCDCWIKIGPVPDDTLIVRALGRVERMVVASPGLINGRSFAGPQDAASLPFAALTPFEGARIGLTGKAGAEAHLVPQISLTTNNIFALYRAALQGIGAGVLPRWFVQQDLDAGRLVDVLPGWRAAELTINAAYAPARRQPRRLALFLDALEENISAVPGVQVQAKGKM